MYCWLYLYLGFGNGRDDGKALCGVVGIQFTIKLRLMPGLSHRAPRSYLLSMLGLTSSAFAPMQQGSQFPEKLNNGIWNAME
jgi:hypothetical protein